MQASMISDKRLESNRSNAQKSTGPRTAEGKARSRRNAWKHGLAGAGVVMPDEDRERQRERVAAWTDDFKPRRAVEVWLVERAAKASYRLDRCVEKETAEVGERQRAAIESWEKAAREWVEQTAAALSRKPAETVRSLQLVSVGCDWLITRWETLARSLSDQKCWTQPETAHALNLLGQGGDGPFASGTPAASLRFHAFAARPERDSDTVDAFWGISTAHLDPEARAKAIAASVPDPETARGALAALIAAQVARLELVRDELWRDQDLPEITRATQSAAITCHDETVLMLRYESAHSMDLHRCLNQLAKLRKEASAHTPYAAAEAATSSTIHEAMAFQPEIPSAEAQAAPAPQTPSEPLRNEPTEAETQVASNGHKTSSGEGNGQASRSRGRSSGAAVAANGSSRSLSEAAAALETSATAPALASTA
jgi:hypothetical protein